MKFSTRLKELRIKHRLTQDELGNVLKVTKSCISCYEKGIREPSLDMLIKIAEYFKVSVDYLIGVRKVCDVKINDYDLKIINTIKNNSFVYKQMISNLTNVILCVEKEYKK